MANRSFLPSIRKLYTQTPLLCLVLMIVGLLSGFAILQPKISSMYFPVVLSYHLRSFLNQVQTTNDINLKSYWKFREFYSPGNFQLNPDVASVGNTMTINSIDPDLEQQPLTYYHSKYLESTDYVVDKSWSIPEAESGSEIIFSDNNTLFYRTRDNVFRLIFIRDIDEMEDVHGLFDYTSQEKELLQDRLWFHQASIYSGNGVAL